MTERIFGTKPDPETDLINPRLAKILIDDAVKKHEQEFPLSVECLGCSEKLVLTQGLYNITIGTINFLFREAPLYRCDPCDRTYLPAPIQEAMATSIDDALMSGQVEHPEPPPPNPRNAILRERFNKMA